MIPQKPGPNRDIHIALWFVVGILFTLLVGLTSADRAMAQSPLQPNWQAIASFYAGRQIAPIQSTWTNTDGTTGFPESGYINLNPNVMKGLNAFAKYGPKSQQGMVLGSRALAVLLHESLHNRANANGFENNNEIMEGDLGWRLIPDMLQRFFGIPMDSAWGRKYMNMVMKELH